MSIWVGPQNEVSSGHACWLTSSTQVHEGIDLRGFDSSRQMCPMTGSAHLSTWVDAETKQRFASAAARQGLSESALLKHLVEQLLATGSGEEMVLVPPVDLRDARLTVRLVPEDRSLLRERAAARTMPGMAHLPAHEIRLDELAKVIPKTLTDLQHGVHLIAPRRHIATVLLEESSDRIEATAEHRELVHGGL
jgi:hypothetical protein